MWMMNDKGFTTIELMMAIAIAGIIMGAVGTFLIFNMRGFNKAKDIIDIQYEGQLAMNQLTDIIRESTGVYSINDANPDEALSDRINEVGEVGKSGYPLASVRFVQEIYDSGSASYINQYYKIWYDQSDGDDKKLKFIVYEDPDKEGEAEVYVFARYVDSFTLEPTEGRDFETTTSLVIRMSMAEGDASYGLQTEVKIRNKTN